MKQYSIFLTIFLAFVLCNHTAVGQCHVSTMNINTGYNPATGLAIAPGTAATPVTDPHWIIASASASIPGAASTGSAAFIIPPAGAWAVNPAANPGGYLSCINALSFSTDGAGTAYQTKFSRQFKTCTDDSIRFTLHIAVDNDLLSLDVDGGTPFGFTETGGLASYYTTWATYTKTIFLSAGTHNFNVLMDNFNLSTFSANNPMGLDIYGTISSATGYPSIVYENDPACAVAPCYTPSCSTISLADSVHICSGNTTTLSASLSGGSDSFVSVRWHPSTGLSDTTVFAPVLTTGTTSGYYYITTTSIFPENLIVNSHFNYTNTGYTSNYPLVAVTGPCSYAIGTNPSVFNSAWPVMGDHTTGSGPMMVVDGFTSAGNSVWCETIPVTPGTTYNFSMWVASMYITSPANLVVTVNGTAIGTTFTPLTVGTWLQDQATWYSGAATLATICITDANLASFGNDFALDDISFTKECIETDSIYISLNPPPLVHLGNDTSICIGNAITLHSSVPYTSPTYLWSDGSTTPSITVSSSGTYNLTVNIAGCIGHDTIVVTVNPLPLVTASSNSMVCTGSTLSLSALPAAIGTTFTWTGPNSFSSTLENPVIPSTTILNAGTYSVTTSLNGCADSSTTIVVINPTPVVHLGNDTSFCAGNTVLLQSSVTYASPSYLWSNGSTAPSITVSSSGNYTLAVSIGGCTGRDTLMVTVKPLPIVTASSNSIVCTGNALNLTASPATLGETFSWTGPNGFSSTLENPTIPSTTIFNAGLYDVVTTLNGCMDSTTTFVLIHPTPPAPITSDLRYCTGDTALPLTASGTNLHWYSASTSLTPLPGTPTPNTSIGGNIIWYVSQTVGGCEGPKAPLDVMIFSTPQVTITAGRPYACVHDTISFIYSGSPAASSMPDGTYLWTLPNSASMMGGGLTAPGPIVVKFDSTGMHTLYLTVTDDSGRCHNTNSIKINVDSLPSASFYLKPRACTGDTMLLALDQRSADAVNFLWNFGEANIITANSNSGGPYEITFPDKGLHTVTVVASSLHGCKSNPFSDTINIGAQPDASFQVNNGTPLCFYDSILLVANTRNDENSYFWTPSHFFFNNNKSYIYGTIEESVHVKLTVSDPYGCVGMDSLFLDPQTCCVITIPTAFTPNNDGKNDYFRPISSGYHKFHIFRVVNRWGQTVFETTEINQGWDGTLNGVPQDMDVYFYYLKYDCGGAIKEKTGEVTLVR